MTAFSAIHALGIIHGDIRAENILVSKDNSAWIIDFEFAEFVTAEDMDSSITAENEALEDLFARIRVTGNKPLNGSESPLLANGR